MSVVKSEEELMSVVKDDPLTEDSNQDQKQSAYSSTASVSQKK